MLEALDEIRKAEAAIERDKQDLLAEITKYSEAKTSELAAKKTANQQLLTKLAAEKEAFEEQQLQAERAVLLTDAAAVSESLRQQYEKHYQQAVDAIIERVKDTYGSH